MHPDSAITKHLQVMKRIGSLGRGEDAASDFELDEAVFIKHEPMPPELVLSLFDSLYSPIDADITNDTVEGDLLVSRGQHLGYPSILSYFCAIKKWHKIMGLEREDPTLSKLVKEKLASMKAAHLVEHALALDMVSACVLTRLGA